MTIGNIPGYERFKPENRTMRLLALLPGTNGMTASTSQLTFRRTIQRYYHNRVQELEAGGVT